MKKLDKKQALKKWESMKRKRLFFERYQIPEELVEGENIITNWLVSEYGSADSIWHFVPDYKGLSEEFIKRHMNRFKQSSHYWNRICMNTILSEDFMEKNQEKMVWMAVSYNQKLSEPFIEKFSEKVFWNYIAEKQVLSRDFAFKHFDNIDYYCLMRNENISKELKEEFTIIHKLTKQG